MYILCDASMGLANVDQESLVIFFVGLFIVFAALILLYAVFHSLPKLLNIKLKRKIKTETGEEIVEDLTLSGEVSAAISAAIHLYFNELHDEEDTVLTIHRINKMYSPWSSKIYNVTKGLNRRF